MPEASPIRIYHPDEARHTILARHLSSDVRLTPQLAARIERVFGRPLTPEQAVTHILEDVRQRGDAALREWTYRIDGVLLEDFAVPPDQLRRAYDSLASELRTALHTAIDRVRAFHQRQPIHGWIEWSDDGSALGQMVRPLERVLIYAPGGTAPYPSTVIMSAVPAQVAGVQEIYVTSPAGKDGWPATVILAAAYACGIEGVYRIGGAQSIAAFAYGTQSIPRVDKIVGPGNIFVALAKRQVYGWVDIDGLAGPTETLIVADKTADPVLVAADLLAQAEHDPLASAILITDSQCVALEVQAQVAAQLETLSRSEVIVESLRAQGGIVVCANLEEAIELANLYAAEHLCLHVAQPWVWLGRIRHAGGVFLGEHSYEALGDYVVGPSHVMPTLGTARFASPLTVRDFTKIISLFGLSREEAHRIGAAALTLAQAEGLTAHAAAITKRLQLDGGQSL
ncbi:MAG: histidinol dehydrogenase [Anaerolineae bacterium]|nr:histidinol dehydrogenase [Anaerolineae bacterium]MDW8072407.1 histidinol dehydrogenase [Anaerolineae bacterium]